jgi:hypothetical protein
MSAVNDRLSYTCPILQRICLFSLSSTLTFTEIFTLQIEE